MAIIVGGLRADFAIVAPFNIKEITSTSGKSGNLISQFLW